ncbi:hypothetical protein [uncultured Stenotrophomonas sp.]|uniref:hypothetical protein n=1 Tax=uncultured Stenotrophomonas sp. TaxID=165438 RepID=UPI0028EC1938|nr:hypothetical protein [uncultured Stenotrophomonas sp.]
MTWVATAVVLIGAAANQYNTHQTQKRQDNELGLQIQQRAARQNEADKEVMKTIADRAASDGDAGRSSMLDQYMNQVRSAQGSATSGLRQVGGVSEAYRQAANDAALGISDYAGDTASLMSRIDAPVRQRQGEAQQNAQLSTALSLIGNRSAGQDFLSNLRLQGIRRNPGLDAFVQVANAYAGAAGGGGGGGANTSGLSSQANGITAANNGTIFNNSQQRWGY